MSAGVDVSDQQQGTAEVQSYANKRTQETVMALVQQLQSHLTVVTAGLGYADTNSGECNPAGSNPDQQPGSTSAAARRDVGDVETSNAILLQDLPPLSQSLHENYASTQTGNNYAVPSHSQPNIDLAALSTLLAQLSHTGQSLPLLPPTSASALMNSDSLNGQQLASHVLLQAVRPSLPVSQGLALDVHALGALQHLALQQGGMQGPAGPGVSPANTMSSAVGSLSPGRSGLATSGAWEETLQQELLAQGLPLPPGGPVQHVRAPQPPLPRHLPAAYNTTVSMLWDATANMYGAPSAMEYGAGLPRRAWPSHPDDGRPHMYGSSGGAGAPLPFWMQQAQGQSGGPQALGAAMLLSNGMPVFQNEAGGEQHAGKLAAALGGPGVPDLRGHKGGMQAWHRPARLPQNPGQQQLAGSAPGVLFGAPMLGDGPGSKDARAAVQSLLRTVLGLPAHCEPQEVINAVAGRIQQLDTWSFNELLRRLGTQERGRQRAFMLFEWAAGIQRVTGGTLLFPKGDPTQSGFSGKYGRASPDTPVSRVVDTTSYTTILTLCRAHRDDYERALEYFGQLRKQQRLALDIYVCTAFMAACVKAGKYSNAIRVYEELHSLNLNASHVTLSVAMDAYRGVGRWDDVYRAFALIQAQDSNQVSNRTLLLALMSLGRIESVLMPAQCMDMGRRILELLYQRDAQDVTILSIAYANLVTVCARAGAVAEAEQYFQMIAPQMVTKSAISQLALAYRLLGNVHKADTLLRNADQLVPSKGMPTPSSDHGVFCKHWNGAECLFELLHGTCRYSFSHTYGKVPPGGAGQLPG